MRRTFLHPLLLTLLLYAAAWQTVQAADASGHAPGAGALALLPPQIALTGRAATQRLVVETRTAGQFTGDVTTRARFVSSNPRVALVDTAGVVHPTGEGAATITARVGRQAATATVTVRGLRTPFVPNFRNAVLPILTKAGCNAGACHGAAAGKGGLKLTLRGFDPDADYAMLTRQATGRRVVPGDPDASLFLLKPTFTIPHTGGERIKKRSQDYALLAGWIRSGAPSPKPSDARLLALDVFPALSVLRPGSRQQILVQARYADGHSADVTRWVKFGSSDNQVATVDDDGRATVTGHGEAAITVWFSSKVTFARLVSPFPNAPTAETYAHAETRNFIDGWIVKKLQTLGLPPAPLCSDAEFVRRAALDCCGILPTPQETDAFVKDARPDKRAQWIESLLARPEYVDYWAYKWSDLLLVSSRKLPENAMKAFSQYIRRSVTDNKGWDRFARELLTAQGSNLENGAANYWLLHKDALDLTETTTQAFCGMSLMCARCHNHPMEKWTQRDYYQMANLFARVRLKNGDQAGETLVLASDTGDIKHPRLGVPLPPRPLDGQTLALDDTHDRRQALADWLTAPANPYFAKALVNRVWRNFMGRGLVEAEDDLRLTNPPSNQELLDALAADTAQHGYDVKRLIRLIMSSAAYQRSAAPVGSGVRDDRYYSHYLARRLPAEVMLDALSQVTGVPTVFDKYPKGTRALQLPDSQIASYFLTAFGRPEREKTCACERTQEPNVAQALHLVNGDTVNLKLRASGGLIDRLLMEKATDAQALNQLYLSALSRPPSATEQARCLSVLNENAAATPEARRQAWEDLFWAVLTDREFLFNH